MYTLTCILYTSRHENMDSHEYSLENLFSSLGGIGGGLPPEK